VHVFVRHGIAPLTKFNVDVACSVTTTRNVPAITIILSKKQLDAKAPGYGSVINREH